jgi:ABC-type cobalamin/Fe3+-siderophores transport system ATPase subunit
MAWPDAPFTPSFKRLEGGERQRVLMALGLLQERRVMSLVEPTSSLGLYRILVTLP